MVEQETVWPPVLGKEILEVFKILQLITFLKSVYFSEIVDYILISKIVTIFNLSMYGIQVVY